MNTQYYREHKVLVLAVVIVALFLLDLLVSVAGAAFSLGRIRSAATVENEELSVRLEDIATWGGRAAWFTGHPSYRLAAALVPDLAVAAHLGHLAADAGSEAAAAYRALGGGRAPSVYSAGRVDLDRVAAARRHLEDALAVIDRRSAALAAAPAPVLDATSTVVAEAGDRLAQARTTAVEVGDLLESLPAMLGAEGPRTYLLAFQSPSEARGGGGLIGVTAELRAEGGRLDLSDVRTVRQLVARMHGRVEAPRWFERTYGPLLATREWRTANVSPNFPVTSRVISRMYQRSTGEVVDGVIAMDPLALAALTDAIGPLRAPGWEVAITKDNARRVLLHDVYRHFHFVEHRQNRYFAALLDEVWEAIGSGDAEPDALASSLADSVAKLHLKVFVRDADSQEALVRIGASGSYDVREPVQMVFNNNWSANKIDFFLHRTQDITVRLRDDGSARVDVDVLLENRIEDLERNVIARPGVQRELPLGLNRMLLTLLMPQEAQRPRLFIRGRIASPIPGTDEGHPIVSQFVDVPAGKEVPVSFSYRWPDAVVEGRFELTLFPQATARPDRVSVTIVGPDGVARARPERALKEPLTVSLRLD